MDTKDSECQNPRDIASGSLDEKRILSFISSPPTPRFTDPHDASLYQTPECYANSPSPHPVANLEDISSLPTTSSETSEIHGNTSLDGRDEADDDDREDEVDDNDDDDDDDGEDGRYRNPEPPKELVEQHLVDADNIGNTVFSKHWVFTTLLNLLKSVEDGEDASSDGNREASAAAELMELEDSLQDDLCKLWDMSMNQEVVNFLVEYDAVDLLTGVIAKSKAPRATEICVGIFGNMACSPVVCHLLGSKKELVSLILLLLESPDAPTLVETMRLLHVCVSSEKSEPWISTIKEAPVVYDQVLFILQSSTNRELLKYTAEFMDKLMEVEEDICTQWSNPELVVAVMEAIKQTGSHVSHILETFLHVLQLVSTCEQGVQALASYCGQVCVLIFGYLKHICLDDIVGVEGRENIISSALSILSSIFSLWDDRMHILRTDFQLFRCTLKILDVVYQKHSRLPPGFCGIRERSGSTVKDLNDKCIDREKSLDCEENTDHDENINHDHGKTECEKSPAKEDVSSMSENERDSQRTVDEVNTQKIEDNRDVSEAGILVEASDEVRESTPTSDEARRDEEYMQEMTKILYEVLQTLLSELIVMLSQLPVSQDKQTNGDKTQPANAKHESTDAADVEEVPKIPMSLIYLDKLCDRYRLQYMVTTLSEVKDRDCVALLYSTGQKHGLKRLCRIIESTTGRTFS